MRAKRIDDTQIRVFQDDYKKTYLRDFWGPKVGDKEGPHAFLVDHPEPGGMIKPHFHIVDQFQIVTGGGGRIGKHAVEPGTVHYTDGYTTYGPIVNGDDGIRYMTLRPVPDPGGKNMPESKALKIHKSGRTRHYQVDMMPLRSGSSARELSEEADGVSVCELKAGPGEQLPLPPTASAFSCGYYVVMEGSVVFEGVEYPRESCIYIDQGQMLQGASTGAEGAIVCFMSFARYWADAAGNAPLSTLRH